MIKSGGPRPCRFCIKDVLPVKITGITSHILYDMPEQLGYSQQYYAKRTAHPVEVSTDEGLTGWGECFGPDLCATTRPLSKGSSSQRS